MREKIKIKQNGKEEGKSIELGGKEGKKLGRTKEGRISRCEVREE